MIYNGFNRSRFKAYRPKLISEGRVREYAVLIPLVFRKDEICIVFQKRSAKISQAGDYCFPGGKVEENESSIEAAIRETEEELLIKPHQIDVLGPSDSIITRSSLLVHSFLGVLYDYDGTYNTDEVDVIVEVPLSRLLDIEPQEYEVQVDMLMPENFPYEKIEEGKQYRFHSQPSTILFYEIDGIVIWGLTAKLLYSALELIKEGS